MNRRDMAHKWKKCFEGVRNGDYKKDRGQRNRYHYT
jgi:hypothetical protein